MLKSLNDSSGWGKFEGEWNDVVGKLKAITIDDKVALPEDINDIFAKAITNTNMRVMVIKDYYEGREDSNTWELMMGRISRLIRKNKDWDTFPKSSSSVKISALSTSTDGGHLGKRGAERPRGHCFICGSLEHHCNACRALKCETCGIKFEDNEERKKHINNCANRVDTVDVKRTKFHGGEFRKNRDKPSDSKSLGHDSKKQRHWKGSSEGGAGRTVIMVDAKNAKVIANALQAIQPSKSGTPGQGKA